MFGLVNESQEYIIDLFPYKSAQPQELAVDAVQHRLEEITLARVFWVEQI